MARVALLSALACASGLIGLGCSAGSRQSMHWLAVSPPMGDALAEGWEEWNRAAKAAWEAADADARPHVSEPGNFHYDHWMLLPPQAGLELGGLIVTGTVVDDAPHGEAHRHDWRVTLFRSGDRFAGLVIEENAYPRRYSVLRLADESGLVVFSIGENWRAGTSFSLYRWDPRAGSIREVWSIHGDEMADIVSFEARPGPPLTIIVHGVRPNKQQGVEAELQECNKTLGFVLKVVYDGHPNDGICRK